MLNCESDLKQQTFRIPWTHQIKIGYYLHLKKLSNDFIDYYSGDRGHGVVYGGGLRPGPLVRPLCLRPQLRRPRRCSPLEEAVVVAVAAEAVVVVALHLRRAPSPTVPQPSPPPPCHRPLQAPRRVAPFPRRRFSPHARLRYSSVASVCGRAGQLPPPRASEREGKEREIGVGMLTSGPAIFLEKNC